MYKILDCTCSKGKECFSSFKAIGIVEGDNIINLSTEEVQEICDLLNLIMKIHIINTIDLGRKIEKFFMNNRREYDNVRFNISQGKG